MIGHDLLTMYSAKAVEYLIAVAFMILFVPFWRFVNGKAVAETATLFDFRERLDEMVEWFRVPGRLYFHPGHAWAAAEDGDVVAIGMDDFAHKLLGRMEAIQLPELGSFVRQGEPAWTLRSDSKSVNMLSPVDGTVVAINQNASSVAAGDCDPYDGGWLFKVKSPRLAANEKTLLHGVLARRWMEESCAALRGRMDPELGRVYQDGGLPVAGMARSIEPVSWDELARSFFLT